MNLIGPENPGAILSEGLPFPSGQKDQTEGEQIVFSKQLQMATSAISSPLDQHPKDTEPTADQGLELQRERQKCSHLDLPPIILSYQQMPAPWAPAPVNPLEALFQPLAQAAPNGMLEAARETAPEEIDAELLSPIPGHVLSAPLGYWLVEAMPHPDCMMLESNEAPSSCEKVETAGCTGHLPERSVCSSAIFAGQTEPFAPGAAGNSSIVQTHKQDVPVDGMAAAMDEYVMLESNTMPNVLSRVAPQQEGSQAMENGLLSGSLLGSGAEISELVVLKTGSHSQRKAFEKLTQLEADPHNHGRSGDSGVYLSHNAGAPEHFEIKAPELASDVSFAGPELFAEKIHPATARLYGAPAAPMEVITSKHASEHAGGLHAAVTEAIHQVAQLAETLRSSGKQRMELLLTLDDGQELKIGLRMVEGQVRPEFHASSAELLLRLEQGWSQFAHTASDRGIRFSAAEFGGTGFDQQRDSRKQHQQRFEFEEEDASGKVAVRAGIKKAQRLFA